MSFSVSNLLQRIATGSNRPETMPKFKGTGQSTQKSKHPVYFSIDIRATGGNELICDEIPVLLPGDTYIITVFLTSSGLDSDPCLTIDSDLSFLLSIEGISQIGEWTVCPDYRNSSFEFSCTLPLALPEITTKITLEYCEAARSYKHYRFITSIPVSLQGNFDQESQLVVSSFTLISDEIPPNELVVFKIAAEKDHYVLTLANRLQRKHNIEVEDLPNISLAKFVENRDKPGSLISKIRPFSTQDPYGICSWLKPLYKKFKHELKLIIFNLTNNEFPWELLEFEEDDYLGSSINVTRSFIGMETGKFGRKGELNKGNIVAYIDSEGLTNTQVEEQSLGSFSTKFVRSLDEVSQILKGSIQEYEFAYLATHGAFASADYKEIFLGSLLDNINRILYLEDLYVISACQDKRPIIFVNACHSGRIVREKTCLIVGLPYVFLERFARGYIGTLGPVSSKIAAEFGNSFISKVSIYRNSLSISEILRLTRLEAVRKLLENKADEECQKIFLFSFMYVFFGDPWDSVNISTFDEGG